LTSFAIDLSIISTATISLYIDDDDDDVYSRL
jgi:hypothetical protein